MCVCAPHQATFFFTIFTVGRTGPSPHHQDEEVFRSETVTSMGQVIGIVLAGDRATAQRAARKVKVTYEDLPAIITIEVRLTHHRPYQRCVRIVRCFVNAPHACFFMFHYLESLSKKLRTGCRTTYRMTSGIQVQHFTSLVL